MINNPIDKTALVNEIVSQITPSITSAINDIAQVSSAVETVKTDLASETAEIDSKLNSMTAVNGQLDNNVTAINNHTTQAIDSVDIVNPYHITKPVAQGLAGTMFRQSATHEPTMDKVTVLELTGAGSILGLSVGRAANVEMFVDGVLICTAQGANSSGTYNYISAGTLPSRLDFEQSIKIVTWKAFDISCTQMTITFIER